jgi:hypothetical protein
VIWGLWLDVSLSPTLLYEYPTIKALSSFLAGKTPTPTQVETASEPAVVREQSGQSEPIAIVGMSVVSPEPTTPSLLATHA